MPTGTRSKTTKSPTDEPCPIDRLIRFLNALGQRVEITVRPNAKRTASLAVVVA